MERYFHFGKLSLIPLLMLAAAYAAPGEAQTVPCAILDKFRQSVFTVNAYCMLPQNSEGKTVQGKSLWRKNVGTAFPIGGEGYLITMNCVIRNARKVQVVGADGKLYDAEVVGNDAAEWISVLKIRNHTVFPPPPVCPMGEVKSGGGVVLLGAPPGKIFCAISGSVCSVNNPDGTVVVTVSGEPGTSGTPVFDEQGRLIGLLAYHLEDDSFPKDTCAHSYLVLPMEYATLLARTIINRHESRSGWLGISTPLSGLSVVEVAQGSPAEKSGIKAGDRVLEFNDSAVATPEDLVRVMGSTHPGDTVHIRVLRGAKKLLLTAKLIGHPVTR